jgi:hypothetical protein
MIFFRKLRDKITRRKLFQLTPFLEFTPISISKKCRTTSLKRAFYSFCVFLLSLPIITLIITPTAHGMSKKESIKAKYLNYLKSHDKEMRLSPFDMNKDKLILAAHTNNPHTDIGHVNNQGINQPHQDIPGYNQPHQNQPHQNQPHQNVAHTDIPAVNDPGRHGDQSSEFAHVNVSTPHTNTAHTDIPHTNISGTDIPHTDIAHQNSSHTNDPHVNTPHSDNPHSNIAHTNQDTEHANKPSSNPIIG